MTVILWRRRLSSTLGLVTKSEEALASVAQAVSPPLLLLSGTMLSLGIASRASARTTA